MRAVRRKTAEHLSAAWATIPHVTQHDLADITGARGAAARVREAGRSGRRQPDRHVDRGEDRRGGAEARSRSSTRRSTWRPSEIIYKKYVNIGVAVDTDRGLLVPVIRDADTKNIMQIVGRAGAALREGAHPQDLARGDAGRLLQHLEPRRHRRHLLHADRQRAGSGDPRHLARADGAGLRQGDRRSSRRASCCRCRCPTTTASSTAPTASASCAGSSRRSSSRSCWRFRGECCFRAGRTGKAGEAGTIVPAGFTRLAAAVCPSSSYDLNSTRRRRRRPGRVRGRVSRRGPRASASRSSIRKLNPGGVCVYRGCIPSKALLHVAKLIDESRHAKAWGVEFGEPKIDLDKLREFKNNVVKRLTSGTGQLGEAPQGPLPPGLRGDRRRAHPDGRRRPTAATRR